MAKRRADKELTDRNWDQEDDEVEEPGEIEVASADVLKGRQILKGRRRGNSSASQNKDFSGFSGFSFKPSSASTPFSFSTKSFTNGGTKKEGEDDKPKNESEKDHKDSEVITTNGADKKKPSYLANLKNLNESVLSWIKTHVDKNPYCILTPVFKDYEKHLTEIMKSKESGNASSTDSKMKDDSKAMPSFPLSSATQPTEDKPSAPSFAFGASSSTTASSTEVKSSAPSFSFGATGTGLSATKTTESKPIGSGFGFGTCSATPSFPGFSFKPATDTNQGASGFSFAVNKPNQDGGNSQEEDDEYVPPKAESKEVEEEGSLYSIKSKLFYQQDGQWKEKGVGFLHLKKSDEKLQLLVRADNSLGNILFNINISPSMPLNRQGKNNVSLMCVPNPPIPQLKDDKKAVPMLIRVKTGEDADQLLEKMEELRKQD